MSLTRRYKVGFRQQKKKPLQVLVPDHIWNTIRRRAFREQRSLSATVTEVLCEGLGIDPKRFGIDPRESEKVGA